MKNIEFTSHQTDVRILAIGLVTLAVAVVVVSGLSLPIPYESPFSKYIGIAISIALGVFALSSCRLLLTKRLLRKRPYAEFIFAPIVWIVLMLALVAWLLHVRAQEEQLREQNPVRMNIM